MEMTAASYSGDDADAQTEDETLVGGKYEEANERSGEGRGGGRKGGEEERGGDSDAMMR